MTHPLSKQHLFVYDDFRPQQAKFVAAAGAALRAGRNLMVHAPTGLGKTAATLCPAVTYALEAKKTIFFLTSRHTQHLIALETLQQLQNVHDKRFGVVDLVGKQHMCLQDGVMNLSSSEFSSYCKDQREKRTCVYFKNTRKTSGMLDVAGESVVEHLKKNIIPLELVKSQGRSYEVCPYEIATELAKDACVIVADYNYIFNESIRQRFFNRLELEMSDCIVIADEAHNLPSRLKDMASVQLTTRMLNLAAKEAVTAGENALSQKIKQLEETFNAYLDEPNPTVEKLVPLEYFTSMIEDVDDVEAFVEDLEEVGQKVRDDKRRSFLLSLSEFIVYWQGPDKGYARILAYDVQPSGAQCKLLYRCLDPSLISTSVIEAMHSVIAMSATLQPLEMYRDLLGFSEDTTTLSLSNPFPKEHVLHMAVPTVTTKFSKRSDKQFDDIALAVRRVVDNVVGNSIVFFPSYHLLSTIYHKIVHETARTILHETSGMSSSDKKAQLENFKQYAGNGGAVLFAVSSGSYGEGVDMPGDLLRCVVVVGIPLAKPDLERQELISYYQQRFGHGWDYGYLIPAFNTVVQNAGRCIRTATDKGVVVYLDERYATQFRKYFSKDLVLHVEHDGYDRAIKEFFGDY